MEDPKLTTLLLCDQVITDKVGKNTVVGVFDQISAQTFPAVHSQMSIFLGWMNNGADSDSSVDVKIFDNKNQLLEPKIEDFKVKFNPSHISTFCVFNFSGILFREDGTYLIVVYLDGEKIGGLPFKVEKLPN